jgi:NAD(P)-dependent dehydrogenase (short-subunit alcohol dehydrogenase family)
VVVADIHRERGEEAVNMVPAQGGEAVFVAADVCRTEDVRAPVEQTAAREYGGRASASMPSARGSSTHR